MCGPWISENISNWHQSTCFREYDYVPCDYIGRILLDVYTWFSLDFASYLSYLDWCFSALVFCNQIYAEFSEASQWVYKPTVGLRKQPRKQLLWYVVQLGVGSAGLELVPLFSDVLGAQSGLGFRSGKALEHQHSWTSLSCWISKHEAVHLTAPHRVAAHCLFMLALSHPWQIHRNVTWTSGKKEGDWRSSQLQAEVTDAVLWRLFCDNFIYTALPTSRIGRTLSYVHSQASMREAPVCSWMKVLCLITRPTLMCFQTVLESRHITAWVILGKSLNLSKLPVA